MSADGTIGVVLVHPVAVAGPDAFAAALPALEQVAEQIAERIEVPVVVTGDAPRRSAEGGEGGAGVLIETVVGDTRSWPPLALDISSTPRSCAECCAPALVALLCPANWKYPSWAPGRAHDAEPSAAVGSEIGR